VTLGELEGEEAIPLDGLKNPPKYILNNKLQTN
jgi:hypothetical protein